ncbi:hypothetical protein [Novosphingobium sp.]|uniref:hypothetical protein n=1 Tax=Novosphingobium sp. TaxID=1874826 RepID=UPI002FDE53CF
MTDAARPPLETFVALCGMPRCGTRQFADYLNRHPRLCIQGEIRSGLVNTIRATLDAAERAYPEGYAANYARGKRAQAVADLFGILSKDRRLFRPEADIHGCKSPQLERQHGTLGAIVAPAFERLVWLHCIRNPVDCWLSLQAMPWFRDDLDTFVMRYCTSLKRARAIADGPAPPGLAVTIHPLDLDASIAAPDRAGWLAGHLFAPLGLSPSRQELDDIVATTANRNATSSTTGRPRPTTLTATDHAGFARHVPQLRHAIRAYNARFGTALGLQLPLAQAAA